ncbi:ferritin-like domain-containing protein [Planctomicrobium sp. SH661]|uniref:YciE/YciF ferroxidase family protein n=1 Tax=Planctomicrobium sp. SH661 TaxID=3448124 RepID=UPI003F5C17F6
MPLNTLEDAFVDELRDVLSAEKQLVKALPKMVKGATSDQLRDALESHLEETKTHVERVEAAFESIDLKPRSKKCEAMEGLLEEGSSLLEEDASPEVMDALIIAAAQKVEHYEIATYGTLCTWAEELGFDAALKLLKQNMADEEAADEKLTQISQTVNRAAVEPATEDVEAE